MQAKIPFRAKVREVGHVGSGGLDSGFGFQRAGGPGFKFQVSRAHPLCPPKIGVTSPQGGGGMTNGKRKGENGKLSDPRSFFTDPYALRAPSPSPDVRLGSLTLMRHKMTFSHFSKGFIRPNLGEESGCGLTYRFQVLGTPLLCPSESGGRAKRRGSVHSSSRTPLL